MKWIFLVFFFFSFFFSVFMESQIEMGLDMQEGSSQIMCPWVSVKETGIYHSGEF